MPEAGISNRPLSVLQLIGDPTCLERHNMNFLVFLAGCVCNIGKFVYSLEQHRTNPKLAVPEHL